MNLRILSDTPAHHKELVDVASLFFGRVNLTEDDSDLTARFTERLRAGRASAALCCRAAWLAPIPPGARSAPARWSKSACTSARSS